MKSLFKNKLIVSTSPHIGTDDSVPHIMWSVAAALVPALVVAAIVFGYYALCVVSVSVITAILTEAAVQKWRRVPITIGDGSAVVTGVLLAYTLPPNIPLYMPILGSAFAVGIAKHAFGGLGFNIWNPALAGRAFLLAAYSGNMVMTKWPILKGGFLKSIAGADAVTQATPCAVLKAAPFQFFHHYNFVDLIFGNIPGSLGETSAIALILGGAYLMWKGYVNWRLPFSYIATVMVFCLVLPMAASGVPYILSHGVSVVGAAEFAAAHALSGGLMLGAFFMATDMVTSPLTSKGQIIFGIGCGALVALIRFYGGYPEGVCYSILIMNTLVWLIDRYTVPRYFGAVRDGK